MEENIVIINKKVFIIRKYSLRNKRSKFQLTKADIYYKYFFTYDKSIKKISFNKNKTKCVVVISILQQYYNNVTFVLKNGKSY